MVSDVLKKVFGTKNEREQKKLWPLVEIINQHYEQCQKLTDEELREKTDEFRQRLAEGETLEDILPEAFAVVKDTCRRLVGKKWMVAGIEIEWEMIPFDVQLLGAIVLHQGRIAEMATGEGKTLVATLPLYLNALQGKGAHLVTVNDYLAQRDAEWMGEIFHFLGLSVGKILNNMDSKQRREAYNCDITYGTNNEFGFDYLRDNMAVQPEDIVQAKGHHYAIVDEVDSVLVDEARTPLIISGPVEHATHAYDEVKPMVARPAM
jgi:preprotein translocase subunit SecA